MKSVIAAGTTAITAAFRKGNPNIERYRLTQESILDCCKQGYESGFRTFVLQGGEDPVLTDDKIEMIVTNRIRQEYPDCAITLSLGEKSRNTYERFFRAGANRYLLRHETYNEAHYQQLHPAENVRQTAPAMFSKI